MALLLNWAVRYRPRCTGVQQVCKGAQVALERKDAVLEAERSARSSAERQLQEVQALRAGDARSRQAAERKARFQ